MCRSAWIDRCQPDLLITESTYATTIRDSKRYVEEFFSEALWSNNFAWFFTFNRCRERDFLKKIHECMERDGKVMAVGMNIVVVVIFTVCKCAGAHPSVCTRQGSGIVHPSGDLLVCKEI